MNNDINNFVKRLTEIEGTVKRQGLAILKVEVWKSIRKNFEVGGRPSWKASRKIGTKAEKKHGNKTLIDTGNLSNITVDINESESKVVAYPNPLSRQYAKIHQEGGTINMPSRKIKFRENKKGKTVFASSRHKRIKKETQAKAYTIRIPERPYLTIPDEDIASIKNKLRNGINIK